MSTRNKNQPPHLSATSAEPGNEAKNCKGYLQLLSKMGVVVGDFYLMLGASREQRELPRGVVKGIMKQCYKNAGELALSDSSQSWAYCEGYALRRGLIPVHHAWCLDEKGKVVDPTWPREDGNEYFGVALAREILITQSLESGYWGLLSERLADFVIEQHPTKYLDSRWLPAAAKMDEFWELLKKAKGR